MYMPHQGQLIKPGPSPFNSPWGAAGALRTPTHQKSTSISSITLFPGCLHKSSPSHQQVGLEQHRRSEKQEMAEDRNSAAWHADGIQHRRRTKRDPRACAAGKDCFRKTKRHLLQRIRKCSDVLQCGPLVVAPVQVPLVQTGQTGQPIAPCANKRMYRGLGCLEQK